MYILYSQAGSWKNYPCPCKGKEMKGIVLRLNILSMIGFLSERLTETRFSLL